MTMNATKESVLMEKAFYQLKSKTPERPFEKRCCMELSGSNI